MDLSPDNLKFDTPFAAYFPSEPVAQMFATWGSTVAFIGYGAAKIVCISPLALASGSVAGAWVGAECLAFLAVRAARGQWRGVKPGIDGAVFGLFIHVFIYLPMLGCPFTFMRVGSTFLTPHAHRQQPPPPPSHRHHSAPPRRHHNTTRSL